MTTKTRNEYIALVVILAVLGYLMYHYFFASSSNTTSATNTTPLLSVTPGTVGNLGNPLPSGNAPIQQFLPNGTAFDSSVLQNPEFTSLVALPEFTVSAADLGLANPFNSAITASPSTTNAQSTASIPVSSAPTAPTAPSAVITPSTALPK